MSETLYDTVKRMRLDARKAKNTVAATVLGVLIGELDKASEKARSQSKEFTDTDTIGFVKKLIQSNNETLKHRVYPALIEENEILEGLLPKQLSEDQIRTIIATNELSGVPAVMQFLGSNYPGQFDRALAASIARS
jgi:uncharacterized protein YqeY